jgi:hypothetical protein
MRQPPQSFRQQRTEEMRRRFHADIAALHATFEKARGRFSCDVPPLLLAGCPDHEIVDTFRRAELEIRNRIDTLIRHWLDSGEWGEIAASEEYWIAERFRHAAWLSYCLISPDRDGHRRYLPTYGGELLSGYREWLLIHSWAGAGCDRFLDEL